MTNSYLPPSIMFKGGQSWMYRTRLAIYITRVNEKPVAEGESFVTKLRFSFLKDMSARGNKLPVSVYASNSVVEDVDGGVCARRIVKFDWDAATIDLFKDPDKYGYPETFAKIISETIGFKEAKKGTKNGYIAPNIGVNEPTTVPSEIVDALYAHPKELDLLRASLGIRKGIEILPDLPYKDAVKKSKEIAKKRSEAMLDGKTATVIKKGTLKS
jgi:hypothetical protein